MQTPDEGFESWLPDLTGIPFDEIDWDDPQIQAALQRTIQQASRPQERYDC